MHPWAEVSFGEWLKRRRKGLGLTQGQLAAQIKCSTIALKKIEAEERKPSAQMAERIAEILQIPQGERTSFLQFARGDWRAAPGSTIEHSPWLVSSTPPRSNLPASINALIGRETEIRTLHSYLSDPIHRLITLIGPPGIGKTRLSLEAASGAMHGFQDGVFFVALDSLDITDPITPTILHTLDVVDVKEGESAVEQLQATIGEKHMLLLLDNCEHLIEDVAILVSCLLSACSQLVILTTSREALRVPGEQLYALQVLRIPMEGLSVHMETAAQFPALTLFAERARAVQADFALNSANIETVTRICQQSDGLPLAIELLAAEIRYMSPQALLSKMSGQFIQSAEGMRAVADRQKTLQNAIRWSYNLLLPEKQKLFAYVSVFSGGFTLEMAERMFSELIPDHSVSNLVISLFDKSLLRQMFTQEEADHSRFGMLATIHQYARQRLVMTKEQESIRHLHLRYFLELSEQAESGMRGFNASEWHRNLTHERNNIRAALEWAEKTDVEAGMYISSRLHDYWESFDLREGQRWLTRFVEKTESQTYPRARAKALFVLGDMLYDSRQFSQARSLIQESLELYRVCDDKHSEVSAILSLAYILESQGDRQQSIEFTEQALALSQGLNDPWRQAFALANLGHLRPPAHKNRLDFWEKVIDLFRKSGDSQALADRLGGLGLELVEDGDIDNAQKYLAESTLILEQLHTKAQWMPAKYAYSLIAVQAGNYEQARALLGEIMLITNELGGQMSYFSTKLRLGHLAIREGKLTEARNVFAESIQMFQRERIGDNIVFTLEGVASLFVAIGKFEHASGLFGWADATRKRDSLARPHIEQVDVDRDIQMIVQNIGNTAFESAYDVGRTMSLEDAITYALEDLDG
ncbi:MAG TPA: helix-turn-helix domain-containing protein [Anaerolineales bacterium]|nr:helix-turn-helix domain-containing protein [Anaerolineales bacterium]